MEGGDGSEMGSMVEGEGNKQTSVDARLTPDFWDKEKSNNYIT